MHEGQQISDLLIFQLRVARSRSRLAFLEHSLVMHPAANQ